jgi:F-type H+-transporting ATPase subunit epsilon
VAKTTFRCSIVTPTAAIFDGPVTYVSLPAWDGQLGVMIGQSPLLSRLGTGTLRLDTPDGSSKWFMVDGGFAQVQDDLLTLLTDAAAPAESLNLEEARAELAEANARVARGGEDQGRVVGDQRRAMAKIALIEKVGAPG